MKLQSPIPHKKTRLEIIPLIDVMFFLLASFMMVSLTQIKQHTIKVDLPVASSGHKDMKPDIITLGVNAAGDVYMDKDPVSLPELENRLREKFHKDPAIPVYISGDSATPFAQMVKALDAVRRIGFHKVAFNVKPTDSAGPPAGAPVPAAPAPAPVSAPASAQ